MRSRVAAATGPVPLRASEAVDGETPARRATSASVARVAGLIGVLCGARHAGGAGHGMNRLDGGRPGGEHSRIDLIESIRALISQVEGTAEVSFTSEPRTLGDRDV